MATDQRIQPMTLRGWRVATNAPTMPMEATSSAKSTRAKSGMSGRSGTRNRLVTT